MRDLIEGRNAVVEAMRAGVGLHKVYVATGMKHDETVEEILRRAREAAVPVESVSRRQIDAMSEAGAHQGVIAESIPFQYASLRDVLDATRDRKRSLLVALDHVTDPHNLGAVIRSAEVAGADGVILPKRRSASVGPVVYKSSAGAVAHVPIVQETNLVRSLDALKGEGYWIVGASERARETLWDAPLDGRLVLVLGAEGSGLSRLVEKTCDLLVRIPVAGRVSSLNVAQAATVLAFEWARREESESAK